MCIVCFGLLVLLLFCCVDVLCVFWVRVPFCVFFFMRFCSFCVCLCLMLLCYDCLFVLFGVCCLFRR